MANDVMVKEEIGLGFCNPDTLDEALKVAETFSKSALVPKEYQGKPENIIVAMEAGREVGLKLFQALQAIAVVNGRATIWGDAAIGLVMQRPECKDIRETFDDETMTAKCVVSRSGKATAVERTFSQADAERAGLWDKGGTWQEYPKRMLQLRARGFALRDAFPDVLRGLVTAEEAHDYSVSGRNNKERPESLLGEDEGEDKQEATKKKRGRPKKEEAKKDPDEEKDFTAEIDAPAHESQIMDDPEPEKDAGKKEETKKEEPKQEADIPGDADTDSEIFKRIGENTAGIDEKTVNEFLVARERIKEGQTWKDVDDAYKGRILKSGDQFFKVIQKWVQETKGGK